MVEGFFYDTFELDKSGKVRSIAATNKKKKVRFQCL